MQKCGRPRDAVHDFRQSAFLLLALKEPSSGNRYDLACVQSMLAGLAGEAGSGLRAEEGPNLANEAMTSLRRAIAAGWNNPAWALVDADLVPIRSRADFQAPDPRPGLPGRPVRALKGTGSRSR
jgi:hypothetical protein